MSHRDLEDVQRQHRTEWAIYFWLTATCFGAFTAGALGYARVADPLGMGACTLAAIFCLYRAMEAYRQATTTWGR